jgi:probable selenium-dependent hydroxylase accessory protein YqeC
LKLYLALGVSHGDVIAFAGAGGKSSALLEMAGELAADGTKVLVVPTTKMFVSEAEKAGPLVIADGLRELTAKVKGAFADSDVVVAGSGLLSKKRVGGVEPEWVGELAKLADVALVEADGSRRRPIKGTEEHEPLLPDSATVVVAVGNVRALGTPVDEEHVHRPQVFSKLTGIAPGQSITPRAFARALAEGSLGKLPKGARPVALITGVEPGRSMADAAIVTRELWRMGVKKVVLASLPDESPGRVWIP